MVAVVAACTFSSCEGGLLTTIRSDVQAFQSQPVITSVGPSYAATAGETVTVEGSALAASGSGEPKVFFSGVEGTVSDWTDTSVTATVPAGGGSTITVETEYGESNQFEYQIWQDYDFPTFTIGIGSSGSYRVAIGVGSGDVARLIVNNLDGNAKYMGSMYNALTGSWSALQDYYTGSDQAGYNSGNMRLATDPNSRELHLSWFSTNDKLRYASVNGTDAWPTPSSFVYEPTGQKGDTDIAVDPVDGTVTIAHSGNDGSYTGYYVDDDEAAFTDSSSGKAIHGGTAPEVYNVAVAVRGDGQTILATGDYNDSGTNEYTIRMVREHSSGAFTTNYFGGLDADDTGLDSYSYLSDIRLIVDSGNRPALLFRPTSSQLNFALYTGSLPFEERVISTQASGYYDLQKDSEGNLYVVYGTTGGEIWLDRFDKATGTWAARRLTQVESGASLAGGIHAALDSKDRLYVVYMQSVGLDITPGVFYTKP